MLWVDLGRSHARTMYVVGRPGQVSCTDYVCCWTWAGLMHGLCMLLDLGRSHARTMYVVGRPGQVSCTDYMYVVGRPGKVSTVSQVGEWPPPLLPIPYYTCWLWLYWLSSQPACNL